MSRLSGDRHMQQKALLIPVAWILALLVCWLLLAEWRQLPALITSALAALP